MSYLVFTDVSVPTQRTKRFEVTNMVGNHIGRISFYPQWRKYIFSPTFGTMFDVGCLQEIEGKLTSLMKERQL